MEQQLKAVSAIPAEGDSWMVAISLLLTTQIPILQTQALKMSNLS